MTRMVCFAVCLLTACYPAQKFTMGPPVAPTVPRPTDIAAALPESLRPGPVDQPVMGSDGVPEFVGRDFRHAADTPFYCFEHVSPKGTEVSACHAMQEWCARDLAETKERGLVVLGGCKALQKVACLTFYRGDATKTSCYATPAHCEVAYGLYLDPSYGARRDQVTACTTIDQSWQPPARSAAR
ncbi:hypothetical protein OV203_46930 [Nannocystis sp. ILAH1]|uniref:hypothetical protein n=1 Tax=Nannocystis sp. ILAH1 TaxID=2996789 RepID=UPI00226FDB70|nr:hypothetical protein [Nannocystis sp. ILAH1]MCY0994751.1 hypothetical protein [Nannocystis sp. ILAH1]